MESMTSHNGFIEHNSWEENEDYLDRNHLEFCAGCAGTMDLIGCQTCDTSYHAGCMIPTMEPDEVPAFWYCPHCVDRELNNPAPLPTMMTIQPENEVSMEFLITDTAEITQSSATSTNTIDSDKWRGVNAFQELPKMQHSSPVILSRKQNLNTIDQASDLAITRGKPKSTTRGTKTRAKSPARKRSKYSSLASDVDKALTVIQKQLEIAAQTTKLEDSLREQIQRLEQQLKLKDGQITLSHRELEVRKSDTDRCTAFEYEIGDLKRENEVLKGEVERRDSELREWRERLRGLMGDDLVYF